MKHLEENQNFEVTFHNTFKVFGAMKCSDLWTVHLAAQISRSGVSGLVI